MKIDDFLFVLLANFPCRASGEVEVPADSNLSYEELFGEPPPADADEE